MDRIVYTPTCIVVGCEVPAVCLDTKNYTQRRGLVSKGAEELELALAEAPEGREIWYCEHHAKMYLFPIIDVVVGNTMDTILSDFKEEDLI